MKAYAGIGSRETPLEICTAMGAIAIRLAGAGFLLRSGGADGADKAFGDVAREFDLPRQIYLPWRGFNEVTDEHALDYAKLSGAKAAWAIAERFYPRWNSPAPETVGADLKKKLMARRKLMARNVMQVLGDDCDSPARFVICWATGSKFDKDGRIKDADGGTGQAVRIAYAYRINVYNLAVPDHAERLAHFIGDPNADWLPRTTRALIG